VKHIIAITAILDYRIEAAARKALAGHGQLPYRGVWIRPIPEEPLVHVFTWATTERIEQAGWRRPAWVAEPEPDTTDRRTTA
jgi:hypothetical protein